jgi:putative heme-binding domain-containing protein
MTARILSALACFTVMPAHAGSTPASTEQADRTLPAAADHPWLETWLVVPDDMADPAGYPLWRDSMTLTLPAGMGRVAVLINGKAIHEPFEVPPDRPLRCKIPRDSFQKGLANSIVLQCQQPGDHGRGMAVVRENPPVLAGYFDEVSLARWSDRNGKPEATALTASDPASRSNHYSPADFRPATTVMQASPVLERGLFIPPDKALSLLQPHEDFTVESLLHEPLVAQPTHLSYDERGRLWVSQYRQYPYPAGVRMISRDKYYRSKYDRIPPPPPHHDKGADRITVHEDTDGDGSFDRHRTVLDGLNMANAALRGAGGLWVMQTPYLVFWPDPDGDDQFDGPPEVRLSGFGLEDTHSVANGLAWGPDGWLYGGQGSTTTCRVVRPDTDPPDAQGTYIEGCMVWRYHPSRRLFEIFADGGGNTFGVSFDADGRLYTGHNGGDTRGWHQIQDGLYLKQGKDPGKFGPPSNPFAFGELPMMASSHPIPRFSHMTIMAEGTAIPEPWRGSFFATDPLHHSIISAQRIPHGSTFRTTDLGKPLTTDDRTFRPVFLAAAPDGSITIADFREEYIAHGQNYQSQIDPDTGRIYRLRGSHSPPGKVTSLAGLPPAELLNFLRHPNPWQRQTAVRLLAESGDRTTTDALRSLLAEPSAHPALEALWVLHRTQPSDELTLAALQHPAAPVRSWALRLAGDERLLSPMVLAAALRTAGHDPSPEVRCQIASTARRLPAAQALALTAALASRTGDESDPFLPLMLWFVIESHCASHPDEVLALFQSQEFQKSPLTRQYLVPRIMRRFAAPATRTSLLACRSLLKSAPDTPWRDALLRGFEEAFAGQPLPTLPDELLESLAASGKLSLTLRVRQGNPGAIRDALQLATDSAASPESRLQAIRVFGEIQHAPAEAILLGIVTGNHPEDLRSAAVTALQRYSSPQTATDLVAAWPSLPPPLQSATLGTLTSRPAWTATLLKAVSAGTIPPAAFSRDAISRIRAQQDPQTRAAADAAFPPPRPRDSVQPTIASLRKTIASAPGDPYRGEPLFQSLCGSCHLLFHKGGRIGPDLTPYQRDDLGTLLVSIVDPDAEIREGFENVIVATTDGRTIGGFLTDENNATISLRGFDGAEISLRRTEISSLSPAGHSLMPPGLLDALSPQQIRDLFAYLRQSQPISR